VGRLKSENLCRLIQHAISSAHATHTTRAGAADIRWHRKAHALYVNGTLFSAQVFL
jgi:hypothetical protein